MELSGNLHKMPVKLLDGKAHYTLELNDEKGDLNGALGEKINLHFTGQINCVNCGRKIKKTFGQGFCFPCFRDAPQASECIIHPERCRGHLGEGRDPEWEQKHHVQPHFVYLAVSSGLKVGITRETQIPTRWIDQGARAGIILAKTTNRYEAGVIEVALKEHFADKTSWQRMLKGDIKDVDLLEEKEKARKFIPDEMSDFFYDENDIISIEYPLLESPDKVKSVKFDKEPTISGTLTGIKGQYLILDNKFVTNIRNQSGYFVEVEV
ncbi:DUF2797 domain-containing protein [Salibacter halophilus]|nr:DUF2797 domain-containing protein [Salibacter halophilus]